MAEVESGNLFPKLSELNYSTWNENIESRLKCKALWRIITGDKKAPATTDLAATELYLEQVDKAAGEILGMITEGQKTCVAERSVRTQYGHR